jgi:hypothetical protein
MKPIPCEFHMKPIPCEINYNEFQNKPQDNKKDKNLLKPFEN